MDYPKVSVVVACARDNPLYEESLARQDYPDYEVISIRGLTAAGARNAGIDKAAGQIIVLIDDDVVVPPGWISAGVKALLESGADIVGGPNLVSPQAPLAQKISDFLLTTKLLNDFRRKFSKSEHRGFSIYKDFATCNIMLRRTVFSKVGLFNHDYKYGEDMEFLLRCAVAGVKMYYTCDFFLYHQRRDFPWAHMKQVFLWGYWNMRLVFSYPFMFKRTDIWGSLLFLPAIVSALYFYPRFTLTAALVLFPVTAHFLSYSLGVTGSLINSCVGKKWR